MHYRAPPLPILCALAWGVYAPMASHVSSWYLNHGSAESTHCRKLHALPPASLMCSLAWGVYAPMASHVSSWYLNHGSAESTHCRKLHALPPASLMCSCMGCLRTNGKPCLLLVLEPRQCRIYPLSEATRSPPCISYVLLHGVFTHQWQAMSPPGT